MELKLVVVGGESAKPEITVKLPAVVGRGKNTTLTLPYALVSRKHCELEAQDDQVVVRDLGSLNGTFIGNERIEEAVLPPGGLLTVGTVTFRAVYGPRAAEIEADGSDIDAGDATELAVSKAGLASPSSVKDAAEVETNSDADSVEDVEVDDDSVGDSADSFEFDDSISDFDDSFEDSVDVSAEDLEEAGYTGPGKPSPKPAPPDAPASKEGAPPSPPAEKPATEQQPAAAQKDDADFLNIVETAEDDVDTDDDDLNQFFKNLG